MRVNVRFVWGARVLGRAGCKGTHAGPGSIEGRGPTACTWYQMYAGSSQVNTQTTDNQTEAYRKCSGCQPWRKGVGGDERGHLLEDEANTPPVSDHSHASQK